MGSGGEAHRLRPGKTELGVAQRRGCDEVEQCRAARGRRCCRSGCLLGEDAPATAATSFSPCFPSSPFSLPVAAAVGEENPEMARVSRQRSWGSYRGRARVRGTGPNIEGSDGTGRGVETRGAIARRGAG
jgi:hypothetical protein